MHSNSRSSNQRNKMFVFPTVYSYYLMRFNDRDSSYCMIYYSFFGFNHETTAMQIICDGCEFLSLLLFVCAFLFSLIKFGFS